MVVILTKVIHIAILKYQYDILDHFSLTDKTICDHGDPVCWILVGIGCAMTVILLIAVIVCIVFTRVVAKGIRFMIQYLPTLARANRECDIERDQNQQQEPQNEGI